MRKMLSVIFIIAIAAACLFAFGACVENVADKSDLYGTWYLAGNYTEEGKDASVTDFSKGFTLTEDSNGNSVAYVRFNGIGGTEESCYALYDLSVENNIQLKENDRWGKTLYTLNVISEDVISVTLPAEDGNGNVTAAVSYYTRVDK